MLPYVDEISAACGRIVREADKKAMEEINPLLSRIKVTTAEITASLSELSVAENGTDKAKEFWSILYRAGDILDEQFIMLKNSTPVPIQSEVEFIKQCLIFFSGIVVGAYGKRQSLFIITPKFQELAKLW